MIKIFVLGVALSLVLVSGGFFSAQANCCSSCFAPSFSSSGSRDLDMRDLDRGASMGRFSQGPIGNNDWERDANYPAWYEATH